MTDDRQVAWAHHVAQLSLYATRFTPERPAMNDSVKILDLDNSGRVYRHLGDTGVYTLGDGYERSTIIIDWDRTDPKRLAKVTLRVDRIPGCSFATGSVWTDSGWVEVVNFPNVMFWSKMPGYLRAKSDAADVHTNRLITRIGDELVTITENGDLF